MNLGNCISLFLVATSSATSASSNEDGVTSTRVVTSPIQLRHLDGGRNGRGGEGFGQDQGIFLNGRDGDNHHHHDGDRGTGDHHERWSFFDPEEFHVTKDDCDAAEFSCTVPSRRGGGGRRRGNDDQFMNDEGDSTSTSTSGIYVCRNMTHPMTGEFELRPKCISTDQAWETDDCGCCGEDCPIEPEYEVLSCPSETQPTVEDFLELIGGGDDNNNNVQITRNQQNNNTRGGRTNGRPRRGGNRTVVCRDATNPFTGIEAPTTMFVHDSMGLNGDGCGCCTENCTDLGAPRFVGPEFTTKTCDPSDGEVLETCTLQRSRPTFVGGGNGDATATEEEEGFFVCRSHFDPNTGTKSQKSVCISSDRALELDECGCCGDECPTPRPEPVDLNCAAVEETCRFRGGGGGEGRRGRGSLVCRSFYHPVDGSPQKATMCVPDDSTWALDTCGCCVDENGQCPAAPTEGFEDEETQLTLALTGGDATTTTQQDSSLGAGSGGNGSAASLTIVVCLAALGLLSLML